MNELGKYIIFEGGEGTGKSTQVARLANSIGALATHEPGGDAFGAHLRAVMLDPDVDRVNPMSDVLLMAAQRAELMASTVAPALESGLHVVSDRGWMSSLAYQGASGVPLGMIRSVNRLALHGQPRDDLIILLDADPRETHARLSGRPDYFERQNIDFHERVREIFLESASQYGAVIIDALQEPDKVEAEVRSAVQDILHI